MPEWKVGEYLELVLDFVQRWWVGGEWYNITVLTLILAWEADTADKLSAYLNPSVSYIISNSEPTRPNQGKITKSE